MRAILKGSYPAGAVLPAERELSRRLGVTRPTLREALQRLHRDGWLHIRQGKGTRVNDVWREGGLNVLGAVVRFSRPLPPGFVSDLLEVRCRLAPGYARAAVERAPAKVASLLAEAEALGDTAEAWARFDWAVHQALAAMSGNPVYSLILNGFGGFYESVARGYFAAAKTRAASRAFYGALRGAARRRSAGGAERVTRRAMQESIELWRGVERRSRA